MLTLLGVGHVFDLGPSIRDAIQRRAPKVVALELDQARFAYLMNRQPRPTRGAAHQAPAAPATITGSAHRRAAGLRRGRRGPGRSRSPSTNHGRDISARGQGSPGPTPGGPARAPVGGGEPGARRPASAGGRRGVGGPTPAWGPEPGRPTPAWGPVTQWL